mgnify:FL=1|tara:strand:+ start:31 stop:504 length:474 start_codon:yes stop_codon:yes gene_type:complete
MAHRKYHSVTVTPVCDATEVENGMIIFNPTKIPGACTRDGSSLLKSIVLTDNDDNKIAIELYFLQVNKPLGTLGAVISITDANLLLAKPLGCVTMPAVSGLGDYVLGGISTLAGIDLVMQSDSDDNEEGAIYVAGVATATKTYTASGINLTLGFEVL